MPVHIVKKVKVEDTQPLEQVEPVPFGFRPSLKKPVKIGEFSILPELDVQEVHGRTKFLVHLFKPYWYRVVSADAQTIKMRSMQGTVFDANLSGSVIKNYMVVVGPEESKNPSEEVVSAVRGLVKS